MILPLFVHDGVDFDVDFVGDHRLVAVILKSLRLMRVLAMNSRAPMLYFRAGFECGRSETRSLTDFVMPLTVMSPVISAVSVPVGRTERLWKVIVGTATTLKKSLLFRVSSTRGCPVWRLAVAIVAVTRLRSGASSSN
ncbi:MAG TPA: hypothetical protein VM620_04025 [Hyphomicrobium sp.]|nr:hypothetical protein [Hyphomicrobium sp.]